MSKKYVIGSFNVRDLSYSTKDEDIGDDKSVRRDYEGIGKIIRDHFDIVALQEVNNENVLKHVFPACSGWEYRWEQAKSKGADSDEGYAFAWNARKLRPEAEPHIWIQHQQDPVLGENGILRYPYYGRFTPSGTPNGGPFCELRLINAHLRWKPKGNARLPASDQELRIRELNVLTKQVLDRLMDRRYGNNKAAYTLLLGDYNLCLKKSPRVAQFISVNEKTFVTVQETPTTLKRHQETDPKTGEKKQVFDGFANDYDHFTYEQNFYESRGIKLEAKAIDSVTQYKNGDFEKHWREISDHIPAALELCLG